MSKTKNALVKSEDFAPYHAGAASDPLEQMPTRELCAYLLKRLEVEAPRSGIMFDSPKAVQAYLLARNSPRIPSHPAPSPPTPRACCPVTKPVGVT